MKNQSVNQGTVSPNAVPTGTDDEVLITTERVVSIRYKVYLLWIILLIIVWFSGFLMPLKDQIQLEKSNYENIELQKDALDKRYAQYNANRDLVDSILEMDSQIVACVNEEKWCGNLPESLKDNDNFSIARSYLLLWDIDDEKMDINEKKILENLDVYLLKRSDTDETDTDTQVPDVVSSDTASWDVDTWTVINVVNTKKKNSVKNGVVNKVVIWDKQMFNNNLVYVPVQLSITFQDKDDLLSFIKNVELRMPEDSENRLLYKISKITYDVIRYDEPQETLIDMNLYYHD